MAERMTLTENEEQLVLLFRQMPERAQANLVALIEMMIEQVKKGETGMRQQFMPNADHRTEDGVFARNEEEIYELCPWAAEVVPCEGGWQVFESFKDAAIWQNQV